MVIPTVAIVLSLITIVIMALCCYSICKRHPDRDDTQAGRRQGSKRDSADPPGGNRQQVSAPNDRKRRQVTTAPSGPGKPDPALIVPSTSGGETKPTGIPNLESVKLKSYKYKDLAKYTDSFSHFNHLGHGGSAEVYKGTLPEGKIAAIKKLKYEAGYNKEAFEAEVSTISRADHKNLVKLLGYCVDPSNRLIVYEYVENKSLRFHLHGDKPILSWRNRIKIAIGTAKGLECLHHHCNPKIIHRDIKADNILLDDNFEPKIADFGLAKDCSYSVTHISTDPRGTFGYLAPEYAKDRKLTDKSDVFSFGVMVLELITGRKSVFFEGINARNLAEWMMPHIEKALESGNYDQLVDSKLEIKEIDKSELARMTYCAAACVYKPAKDRPDMSQIVEALQGKISLDHIWNNGDRRFFYGPSGKRRELYVDTEARHYEEDRNVSAAPPNGDAQQVPVPSLHARTAPSDQDAAEKVPKERKNSVSIDTVLAPGEPDPALAAPSTSGGETKPTDIQKLASVDLKSYKYEDLANYTVYKGTLADGKIAAIKRLKYQDGQKEDEFVAEVTTINRVRRKHLVKLLGYCYENSNRLLVYEYVPNNSLRSHLHGKDKPILSWHNRIKIALGSAKGLEYLHQYCNPKIVHRDIKADNILLDNNFEPKIADFGLARDCSYSVTHISPDPKGTFGYWAPEYIKDRKLTDKSDVFSFGVVLLELINGREYVFFEGKDAHNLAVWMMPHIEKALESRNYDELVDPKLEKKDINKNELARMTYCAAACVYKPAKDRPDMSQIVEALQGNISLKHIWSKSDNKIFYDSSGKRRELYGISKF